MSFSQVKSVCRAGWLSGAAFLVFIGGLSAKGNVYATNIKLNGSTNNTATIPSRSVGISYILNQPADGGVALQIFSGSTLVWSNFLSGGGQGSLAGSNYVVWTGTNQSGQSAGPGIYNITISASAIGFPTWTNITDDSANFTATVPGGISVNKNTNSPFYGRVFIGNAVPSDSDPGIIKCNADGSPADEGGYSDGGYPWPAGYTSPPFDDYSPWKMAVGADDALFVDDWSGNGVVLDFDECVSNYNMVLSASNYPNASVLLSGPCVTGTGSNMQIWMADANRSGSTGILRWNLTNDELATNDTGATVVGISPNGVSVAPFDVSVDTNGNIYTIQSLDGTNDPNPIPNEAAMPRIFRFPPYAGATNFTPTWSVASPDFSIEYASGVAVDPTGRFVAVAVRGYIGNGAYNQSLQNGAVNIYHATDGSLVTRMTTNDIFTCVAWDNVGNVYAGDFSAAVWRAYSPPGTNYAVTPAIPIIQFYSSITPPVLSEPTIQSNQFGFALAGQSNVTYVIEGSSDLTNWVPVATNYATVPNRYVSLPTPADASFFKAVVNP